MDTAIIEGMPDKNLTEEIKKATETEEEALQSMSESFESMLVLLHETEETSASLTMLDENMDNVVSQANSLKDIADRLQENISIFKV